MDPSFNVAWTWTANEIKMARSVIASHNTKSSCAKNRNEMHHAIVDELHARFPRKDRRQVSKLYVKLVVEIAKAEMMSGQQQLPMMMVSNNSGVTVGNPGVHMDEMKGKKTMVVEQHHRKVVVPPQQDMPRAGRFWTMQEHRNFLCGLDVYGRGNWKSIARDFVPTKTAVQVSSHAQKFFRRQESTTKKLRYSINDIIHYKAEPLAQNNSSNLEAFTFTNNAYNPYGYGGFGGQVASMDNPTQVYSPFASQGSSSQTVTWTGGQQAPMFSPVAPTPMMEEDGTAWTSYY